jgi:hypothetical protein
MQDIAVEPNTNSINISNLTSRIPNRSSVSYPIHAPSDAHPSRPTYPCPKPLHPCLYERSEEREFLSNV